MKKIILSALILMSASTAWTRDFYMRKGTVSIDYTDIINGTRVLAKDEPVEIRYSNDNDFCIVLIRGVEFECTVRYRSNELFEMLLTAWQGNNQSAGDELLTKINGGAYRNKWSLLPKSDSECHCSSYDFEVGSDDGGFLQYDGPGDFAFHYIFSPMTDSEWL